MIDLIKYDKLEVSIKEKLNSYITIEFGHIPIVQETEWAEPDWTVIYSEEDEIKTFCNIIEREILVDDVKMKIGGINNVITPKQFRGNGYAGQILRRAGNIIFDELNCELGLLLCSDDLVPYYEKLAWYKLDCPVYFEQSTGEKLWKANAMFLSRKEQFTPQEVKLNGLPW